MDEDVFARFIGKIEKQEDGCWRWTASLKPNGYGQFCVKTTKPKVVRYAHRLSYQHFVGEIPEGLDLDHLCRNRWCVNPAHLEPVTRRENLMRGDTLIAANAQKTLCDRGHEFDGTYRGYRTCSRCARERKQTVPIEQRRANWRRYADTRRKKLKGSP